MKIKVEKLDVDKSVPVSIDLGKLIDLVKNDVVKDIEHYELVKEVNNISTTDASNLIKKLIKTQKWNWK